MAESNFQLNATLEKDTVLIKELKLCKLLLMNDSNYPWFILVPKRNNITEIFELSQEDQNQLTNETNHLAKKVKETFKAHKINIAALGNMVSQLHIHIIARNPNDPSWPNPIWGQVARVEYSSEEIQKIKKLLG